MLPVRGCGSAPDGCCSGGRVSPHGRLEVLGGHPGLDQHDSAAVVHGVHHAAEPPAAALRPLGQQARPPTLVARQAAHPTGAGHPRPARDRPRTTPTARPASGRPAWTSWNRPRSRGCRDHGEPRKLWGYLLVRGGCRAAARTARPNRGGCRRRRLHRPRADSRPHHSTGAHAPGPALWAGLALGDTP